MSLFWACWFCFCIHGIFFVRYLVYLGMALSGLFWTFAISSISFCLFFASSGLLPSPQYLFVCFLLLLWCRLYVCMYDDIEINFLNLESCIFLPSGHSYSGQHSPSGMPLFTHRGLAGKPHWNSGHTTEPNIHMQSTQRSLGLNESPCLYSMPLSTHPMEKTKIKLVIKEEMIPKHFI